MTTIRIAPTKPFTDPQTAARFDMLTDFYGDEATFRRTLLPFLDESPPCSLRLIDWLMTNYSKDHGVMFSKEFHGQTQNVVLDTEYRNWSKTWRRPLFDMFRRGEESDAAQPRVRISLGDNVYETTVAQMNVSSFRCLLYSNATPCAT